MVSTSGLYYLAITGFNNDPTSVGGAIFDQVSFTEVSGPDGVGGGSPITAWTGGGAVGTYEIALNGVEFITAREVPTISERALIVMALLGVAAGAILFHARRKRATA